MQDSTTSKVAQLEEKVKELEETVEAWRQTAHRLDNDAQEREQEHQQAISVLEAEIQRLREKLKAIELIVNM